MSVDSIKPNKLLNVYAIRSTARNVTIQKRKIYRYIKIKVIAFIIILEETNPFSIERCKSKKGLRYLWYWLYSSVFLVGKFDWQYLQKCQCSKDHQGTWKSIKSLDNINLIVMVKRIHEKVRIGNDQEKISFVAVFGLNTSNLLIAVQVR